MGVPKKGKCGGRLGTHVAKSVVLACGIDYAARRVGAADLWYREVYGRGGQGRGRACNAGAPCDRAAAPARRPPGTGGGHAALRPLAARRDRGAGRRRGRAAARPVRGRAAGRLDGGFRAAKGGGAGYRERCSGAQPHTDSTRSRPFCPAAITERDAQECDTSDSKIQLAPRHWIIWIRGTPSGRLFGSAWRMGEAGLEGARLRRRLASGLVHGRTARRTSARQTRRA